MGDSIQVSHASLLQGFLFKALLLIHLLVNLHLVIHRLNDFVNDMVRGNSKVFWCHVIALNHGVQSRVLQWCFPLRVAHEVQHGKVIKVLSNLGQVIKVKAIMQLGKLEHHFHCLGFVCC